MPDKEPITELVNQAACGDREALNQLYRLVYAELRAIAGRYFENERAGHTLQPTALINEVFVELAHGGLNGMPARSRRYFYFAAARAMRHILVDHAKAKKSLKRGGDRRREGLTDVVVELDRDTTCSLDILALDEALTKLEQFNKRAAIVVQLRFFVGLTMEEIAVVLQLSLKTVSLVWEFARAYLSRELSSNDHASRE